MLIVYNSIIVNFDHVQAIDIVRDRQTQRLSLKIYTMLPTETGCNERAKLLGSYTDIGHAQKALAAVVREQTTRNGCVDITRFDN